MQNTANFESHPKIDEILLTSDKKFNTVDVELFINNSTQDSQKQ
jgi:hypothetical protein